MKFIRTVVLLAIPIFVVIAVFAPDYGKWLGTGIMLSPVSLLPLFLLAVVAVGVVVLTMAFFEIARGGGRG